MIDQKKGKSGGVISISGALLADVRTALALSVVYANTGKGARHGNNAYTPHAYSAYVSAVASVEAFVNETFLGPLGRAIFHESPLWDLGRDAVERMDLLLKIIIVPHLLFGRTLKRSEQPYQDFALLCKVRNDIVHFKMQFESPQYIDTLTKRGIALTAGPPTTDYPWPARLSSTEGIRWAYNAACHTATSLHSLVPQEKREAFAFTANNFRELGASEAYAKLTKLPNRPAGA